MESATASHNLQFLTPTQTVVEGSTCEGMIVCGATKILGRLKGFVVDPVTRRLRYLVVQGTGILAKTRLLPVTDARIDVGAWAIQLLNQDDVQSSEPFRHDRFEPFSDEHLAIS